MTCASLDATIERVLADPVIAVTMRADGVDPSGLETLLRATAWAIGSCRREPGHPVRAAGDALECPARSEAAW